MEKQVVLRTGLLEYVPKQSICFISKGRLENIPMDQIIRISKTRMGTMIHTRLQEYHTWHSLQELLQELPENDFARVHRSHIVLLGEVRKVKRCHLFVDNLRIPVSGYYKELLRKKLGRILEQQYRWFSSK